METTRGRKDAMRGDLSHLESVLQQLSKHEERTHRQSVERTSVQAQHRLLKDQLLSVQEELALAQGRKAELCETLGALQQAKEDQDKENRQLRVELQASREAQNTLLKKVAELETTTNQLKQQYIHSLTCRTKAANELLGKLHITGALGQLTDASIQTSPAQIKNLAGKPKHCVTCVKLQTSFDQVKQELAKELDAAKSSTSVLQEEHQQLKSAHEAILIGAEANAKALEETCAEVTQLQQKLNETKLKIPQTPVSDCAEPRDLADGEDMSEKVKVLEDNLAQLNTYADHLELIINQCASCAVKLQSEGTQDIDESG
ncbi:hypothetical protein Poli38472_003648 [Pythium oligandrum]|uniref:Uncharacterized protein n=1 Tax=Pythium oligandrum TaxID=41045 RepID=A0A8K1CN05_PYTOL|nr:hypothetical protein Poli38472_003648 [Pythium oligandrum]|eukprot:TMW65883.1 hypothetical protein Poli38472_003648 [Pythium oligandrum]